MKHSNHDVQPIVCFVLTIFVMSRAAEHSFPVRHVRNPMIRTVYNKMVEDEKQKNDKHEYVRTETFLPHT